MRRDLARSLPRKRSNHAALGGRARARAARSSRSTHASSAGPAVSDASRGEPPFVDQVAKVQRLQRSRLHGRFQREARVQRRWEELKTMAVTMQQQQQLAAKTKS